MTLKFDSQIWQGVLNTAPSSFVCWNCSTLVSSEKGYKSYNVYSPKNVGSRIYICPNCNAPIILDDGEKQVIRPLPGKEIKRLPKNIGEVYNEIRKCMQINSFTAAIMLMRKIIMNIAVHEGAKENLKFIQYVDFLCDNGIVHKKSKKKAGSIRDLGNDANHEIETRTQGEAQNCLEFIELLLIANYEFADEVKEDEE